MKDPLETDARVKLEEIKVSFNEVIRRFMDDNLKRSDHIFDMLDHLSRLDVLMGVLCEQHESMYAPHVEPIEVESPGR